MAKKGRKPETWTHPETGEVINGLSLKTKRGKKRFFPTGLDAPCFGSEDNWQEALFNFGSWKVKQAETEELLIIGDAAHLKLSDELEFEAQSNIPIVLESIASFVGKTILANPRKAAITFKCPPLARLADLDTLPQPSPDISLDELGELYFNKKPTLGIYELRHSRHRWKQFQSITKAKTAKELTQAHVDRYSAAIYSEYESKKRSPSYVSKRFSSIKTIFAWTDKLNKAPEHTKRILALLTALIPPKPKKTLPSPISKRDLHKLLDAASIEEKAHIFLGLNCAFYPGDVRNLTKTGGLDLERGVYAGFRKKTEIPQCSVLWKRTIKAIKAHWKANPNKTDHLFITREGGPYASDTFRKKFAALRSKAKVSEAVTFDNLRDGAASHSGTDLRQSNTLLGHKNPGIADAYALRHPEDVAKACKTLEAFYFGRNR